MVGTVDQRHLQVDHGVAGEHAGLHGLAAAGVHARDVLARDATTGDLVDELVPVLRLVPDSESALGSRAMITRPNCPEPPVCFLWVYSCLATGEVTVSR